MMANLALCQAAMGQHRDAADALEESVQRLSEAGSSASEAGSLLRKVNFFSRQVLSILAKVVFLVTEEQQ